jgi:hypothetical protein
VEDFGSAGGETDAPFAVDAPAVFNSAWGAAAEAADLAADAPAPFGSVPGVDAGAAVLAAAGGFGGAGFSGLIPPCQAGPVYISGESPRVFHFSSKSAAARLGVSPLPTTSFQG